MTTFLETAVYRANRGVGGEGYARRTRTNFGVIDIISQDSEMFHLVAFLSPSDYAKKTLGLGNNSDVITCSVSQQQ